MRATGARLQSMNRFVPFSLPWHSVRIGFVYHNGTSTPVDGADPNDPRPSSAVATSPPFQLTVP
jgi:hypothetical protein